MEIMMPDDASWDDHHHHSSLPESIEDNLSDMYLPNIVDSFTNYISIHNIDSKNNISNIKETITLDIFVKPGIVENLHIGAFLYPYEIETYKSLFQAFHDFFCWTHD